MAENSMKIPVFTVTLDGGNSFEVRVTNGVLVQWDLERQRRGWADAEEGQFLYLAFVSYIAAKRDKKIESGMPFEAFTDVLESVEFKDSDTATPTSAAPEVA